MATSESARKTALDLKEKYSAPERFHPNIDLNMSPTSEIALVVEVLAVAPRI